MFVRNLALLGVALLAAVDPARSATPALTGASSDSVRSVLGDPAAVAMSGDLTIWTYTVGDKPLTIFFEADKASFARPPEAHAAPAELDATNTKASSKAVLRLGKEQEAAGHLNNAVMFFHKCAQSLAACQEPYGKAMEKYQDEVVRREMETRSNPEARLSLAQELVDLGNHDSQQKLLAFGNQLREQAYFLAEASVVHEITVLRIIHRNHEAMVALGEAKEEVEALHYADARKRLEPYSDISPVVAYLKALDSTLAAGLDSVISSISSRSGITALTQAVEKVNDETAALSEMERTRVTSLLATKVTDWARGRFPNEDQHNVWSARAGLEQMQDQAPSLVALVNWSDVTHFEPYVTATVEVVDPTDSVNSAQLRAAIQLGVPAVHWSDGETGLLRVVISDASVHVRREPSDQENISSTYVSGRQQMANPEYLQAENALAEAQREYDDIRSHQVPATNAMGGFLNGLALGLADTAVTKAKNRLAATPPYLYQDLKAAYQLTRYKVTESGSAEATVRIEMDSRPLASEVFRGTSTSTGTGYSGVLPSDSEGLSNGETGLTAEDETKRQAADALITQVSAGVSQLFYRALRAQADRSTSTERVGMLLFAHDVSPSGEPCNGLSARLAHDEIGHFAGSAAVAQGCLGAAVSPETAARPHTVRRIEQSANALKSLTVDEMLNSVVHVFSGDVAGSGFFISKAGLIVTNAHVVPGATVQVRVRDGEMFAARLLQKSEQKDLALLQIDGVETPSLVLGQAGDVVIGSDILALGNPEGLEGTVTKGIVSSFRSMLGTVYVQIDAAISHGSSGGPIVTPQGTVIGVSTWKVTKAEAESLNFGIAASEVRALFGAWIDSK